MQPNPNSKKFKNTKEDKCAGMAYTHPGLYKRIDIRPQTQRRNTRTHAAYILMLKPAQQGWQGRKDQKPSFLQSHVVDMLAKKTENGSAYPERLAEVQLPGAPFRPLLPLPAEAGPRPALSIP